MLTYELVEEFLESAISWVITTAVAKALSFMLVVFATQSIKVGAKSIAKVLYPVIKQIIYKDGDDKVKAIRRFFANIKANWKNYLGIVSAVATGAIPFVQKFMDFGVGIKVFGFNIIPFVMIILTSIVAIIGVVVDGIHGTALWEQIQITKKAWKYETKKQETAPEAQDDAEAPEELSNDDNAKIDEYINKLFK